MSCGADAISAQVAQMVEKVRGKSRRTSLLQIFRLDSTVASLDVHSPAVGARWWPPSNFTPSSHHNLPSCPLKGSSCSGENPAEKSLGRISCSSHPVLGGRIWVRRLLCSPARQQLQSGQEGCSAPGRWQRCCGTASASPSE